MERRNRSICQAIHTGTVYCEDNYQTKKGTQLQGALSFAHRDTRMASRERTMKCFKYINATQKWLLLTNTLSA